MKKTGTKNRRKKNQQVFLPFLPAWVYLIDNASRPAGSALAPGYIIPASSPLKTLAPKKDRTI